MTELEAYRNVTVIDERAPTSLLLNQGILQILDEENTQKGKLQYRNYKRCF